MELGGFMRKRTLRKRFVSVLLVISVMLSLGVPFDLTVFADEEPARGSEIHALLYYIDPEKKLDNGNIDISTNLELVFQRGGEEDPSKTVFKHFTDFADNSSIPGGYVNPWYVEDPSNTSSTNYHSNIVVVDIKDKIAPKYMNGWFMYMNNLKSENFKNIANLDTTECIKMNMLFNYDSGFTSLDLSAWSFPALTEASSVFSRCSNLTSLDISSWSMPKCTYIPGMFSDCTKLETIDISGFNMNSPRYFSGLFSNCKSLKNVNLGTLVFPNESQLSTVFKNCSSLEEVDLSGWTVKKPGIFKEMFSGCTSLKSVDFGPADHWGNTPNYWSYNGNLEQAYESMFENCTSLESLNLTCVQGALICSSMFKGCTSLKEVDLSYAGKGRESRKGYTPGAPVDPNLTGKANIFEDCSELAWVKLSAEGWPSSGNAGTSMPSKNAWRKIDEPNKDLRLTNDELFLNFQAEYAGTWIADSFITFRGNGGTPNFQTVDGNKGVELTFDENALVVTRNGYDFAGWWTETTGGTQIHSPLIPEQWSYYAHWNEHHYKLKLNGNGGTNADDESEYLAADNLGYTEFYELSNTLFTRNGYVLSSWNTRPNGMGTDFSANDSVNKLTEADGAEVTLYAQWHKPDVIIKFDSHGGSAVGDKHYTLVTGQTVLYGDLSDAFRAPDEASPAGYTFLGWFTEENGGDKITAESEVSVSRTLHAHWQKNLSVTFDANSGCFDSDPAKTITTKVSKYGHKLGVLPTPENNNATFKGWFTAQTGGTQITSNTVVTADATYYAQWGYQPEFESNGGTFTSYPSGGYPLQNDPAYVITELPVVTKDNSRFLYWKFGERNLNEELSASSGDPKSITIDLSEGNSIEAVWEDKPQYTVTFDPNGGTGSAVSIKVYEGGKAVGEPTFQKDGYAFGGWFTNPDGTGEEFDPSAAVTATKTYYAKWIQKDCTLTFNPSGGTMYDSATVKIVNGETIPELPGVNRAGYEFAGWWTEPDGTGTHLTTETVINGDQTYYAKWIPQTLSADIYNYSIRWTQDSDSNVTNTGDDLILHPTLGSDISAVLLLSFGIDSHYKDKTIPAGQVQITIPKSMFHENGVALDRNNIDLISTDTYTYTEVGDNYVFTNTVELNEGNRIEFTYTCKVSPRKVKGGYTDENGYYQGDYYQTSFTPSIVVNNSENPLSYSRTLGLETHTKVLTTVSKERSSIALEWNDSWGNKPSDADDYFYVVWHLNAKGSDASSQKYNLSWSEETAHDGTVVYSSPTLGTKSGIQSYGTFNSTVVTKHLRKEVEGELTTVHNEAILNVEWASGYVEHKRVSNSTRVYIPADDSGSRPFVKAVPNYTQMDSHYKNGGQELILSGDEVVLPYNINYAEHKNDSAPVWNTVTEKYTAKRRDYILTDGIKGDAVISTASGNSSYNWGHASEKSLNDSDYYFDSLNIILTEYDAVCLGTVWSDPYVHSLYSDYDDVEIWVRTEGSDSFSLFKTISETSEISVNLPEKTVGYMVKHSSEFYTTSFSVSTNLHLKSSNRVLSLVKDDVSAGAATLVKNKAAIERTMNGETTTLHTNNESNGWISAYELNIGSSTLYAAKNCSNNDSSVDINPSTSTETVPVVISGWGYNNSGNLKLMKSGVFYDLLPIEFSVDKNTVFVRPRTDNRTGRNTDADNYNSQYKKTDKFSSGYYSVEFTDNWMGTGRTLMTVRVTVPDSVKATGLDVYYKMKTSFVNLCTNGLNQSNYVAFEDTTEGQGVPNNRSGLLSLIDSKFRPAYETVDGKFTAYAQDTTNCILPLTYEHGIRSAIKTEGVYKTRNETVGLNSDYAYFVSYAGSSGAHTRDLVFFDVLENRFGGPESEWYGKFENVDVSGVRGIESSTASDGTCAPVVYYATKPRSAYTQTDFDLSRTDIWTTEMPADKSTVTAIAVDCSKTNLGKDFVLDPRSQVSIHINMKSPESAPRNDIVAYNESYIKAKNQELEHGIEEMTRTSVMLHFTPPELSKSAFPEPGTLDENNKVVNGEVAKGSTINYYLNISNPDDTLTVYDIAVEDTLQAQLALNNPVTVSMGSGESISIDTSQRISSYSITESGGQVKFVARIVSLAPGESLTISIPATVNAEKDTVITNTSTITGYNGIVFEPKDYIVSDATYHVVTDIKVKIKKVNSKGEGLPGATLQILNEDKSQVVEDNFTSTDDVMTFNIQPGDYYLHEVSTPSDVYKTAADIPFTIDIEGICHVDGQMVNYVEMIDQPKYKIIFHENKPNGTTEEKQKIFRIYEPSDLTENKIVHFYDIPEWAGDEYVFAGWYSNDKYDYLSRITNDSTTAKIPLDFEGKTFTQARSGSDPDYHLYAKWIEVGTVAQDEADTNVYNGTYRGFGLVGVQIRPQPGKVFNEETGEWEDATMYDPNIRDEGISGEDYNDSAKPTPEGMRFVTSLSETLLSSINGIGKIEAATNVAKTFGVEYGYVVGTEANINIFTNHYQVNDPANYLLQYKGENVNGKNTTGTVREVDKDFRFITNVDCTSKEGYGTKNNNTGVVKWDHRNFDAYRLYTLVVTYEGDSASYKGDKIAARSYIRYYDANGKLRVFYNIYKKSMYGGCMCSFNQAYAAMYV